MREDTWPDVQEVIAFSNDYTGSNHLGNKTNLARLVTSESIHVKLQQMHDFFNDVRARARNFDHDWKKYMGAYMKVWLAIKTEDTTEAFYKQLHDDFLHIMKYPHDNTSMQLLEIFTSEPRFGTKDPEMLFRRTNADLAIQNTTTEQQKLEEWFYKMLRTSNIATVVNERDDKFFESMEAWIRSLQRFLDESKTDESFFKYVYY